MCGGKKVNVIMVIYQHIVKYNSICHVERAGGCLGSHFFLVQLACLTKEANSPALSL